jgi:hypothetical protein
VLIVQKGRTKNIPAFVICPLLLTARMGMARPETRRCLMFKKLFLSNSENGPIIKEVLCEHLSEEETRTVEVLGERFGFRCFM